MSTLPQSLREAPAGLNHSLGIGFHRGSEVSDRVPRMSIMSGFCSRRRQLSIVIILLNRLEDLESVVSISESGLAPSSSWSL